MVEVNKWNSDLACLGGVLIICGLGGAQSNVPLKCSF